MMFAGIDGGGTSTRCLIADSRGNIVGRADGGPSNLHENGADASARVIVNLVVSALGGWNPTEPLTAVACISGLDTPESRSRLRNSLTHEMPTVTWHTENDAVAAWTASFPDETRGIVAISGTGAIALARNGSREARAGGWGAKLGDPGSGYDIGRRGLIAVLRAADGMSPPTSLAASIVASLGLQSVHQIVDHMHFNLDASDVAALAPLVTEQAELGDPAATNAVNAAAQSIVEMAVAAATAVGLDQVNAVPLALMGGLAANKHFVATVEWAAAQAHANLTWRSTDKTPTVGALQLAIHQAGPTGASLFSPDAVG
jgi:N-acetylglucosamine kinase-like BadF-type ATPase